MTSKSQGGVTSTSQGCDLEVTPLHSIEPGAEFLKSEEIVKESHERGLGAGKTEESSPPKSVDKWVVARINQAYHDPDPFQLEALQLEVMAWTRAGRSDIEIQQALVKSIGKRVALSGLASYMTKVMSSPRAAYVAGPSPIKPSQTRPVVYHRASPRPAVNGEKGPAK